MRQPVALVAMVLILAGVTGKCETCFGFESRVDIIWRCP
jgi:hypothetical protein